MSWLALLMIGFGVTDLVFSIRPLKIVPECIGAAAAVLVGLLAGMREPRDVAALVVIVALVVAWGQTVGRGFASERAWLPLAVLGGALVLGVGCAGLASPTGGAVAEWVGQNPLPLVLPGTSPDQLLLVLGAFLVQMSTGNVVVRLVLSATGTVNPARAGSASDPEMQLKGGRLLGPMERIFILGLGLAGNLTAAAIVIAAKGLLRFPELQSRTEQERIHQLTEYFLVGSFASWLFALGSLVLV